MRILRTIVNEDVMVAYITSDGDNFKYQLVKNIDVINPDDIEHLIKEPYNAVYFGISDCSLSVFAILLLDKSVNEEAFLGYLKRTQPDAVWTRYLH